MPDSTVTRCWSTVQLALERSVEAADINVLRQICRSTGTAHAQAYLACFEIVKGDEDYSRLCQSARSAAAQNTGGARSGGDSRCGAVIRAPAPARPLARRHLPSGAT